MFYFTDKIMTGRAINSEFILTIVQSQFAENIIIGNRSAGRENMYTCIHNPLVKNYIFKKFSYLQTLPQRNSLPMITKGDTIFVVDVADEEKRYIMVTVQ